MLHCTGEESSPPSDLTVAFNLLGSSPLLTLYPIETKLANEQL
jgi:hypothetical protein